MRAVVYRGYGVMPELAEVPEPGCPEDGVVLSVAATGVCRSDWHAWKGHEPVPLPHIPGHELAGTIAQAGPAVTRWQPGDRVTVPFACGCGLCEHTARAGDAQVCPDQTQPGFTGPGSFAERVAIHAADTELVALPDAVEAVTAASLGCRFATAYRALTGYARLRPGSGSRCTAAAGSACRPCTSGWPSAPASSRLTWPPRLSAGPATSAPSTQFFPQRTPIRSRAFTT